MSVSTTISTTINFPIKKIAIIGLGLIGGSWVKALREQGVVETIVGSDRNLDSMQFAKAHNIIDEYSVSASKAVEGADVVILSVPILASAEILKEIKGSLSETAIVTDVGSVKGQLAEDIRAIFGADQANFVLGHPIAGSEKSGITAADETLFQNHKVILTPQPNTSAHALECVRQLWQAAGADIEEMSVAHHDEVLAATSHLPHLLAYSLVDTLAHSHENKEIFNYAAGGFRDFTRIAASNPKMWHDIFTANKPAVLDALDLFTHDLASLRQAVVESDSTSLMGVFTRAKVARDHFSKILARRAYVEPMKSEVINYIAQPGAAVTGTFRVPGDKSISHRSIMLGSLANGTTEVTGFLEGEDSLATLQSFRDMGVVIEGPHRGRVTIHGVGLHGLKQPPNTLYVGNSGTSMRLLSGLMAGQSFDVEMTGDESLSKRPMNRVANPLREMGAEIETAAEGRPPMLIKGQNSMAGPLSGITYTLPMASAQVKSCLLLAGLYAEGKTKFTPSPLLHVTIPSAC